MDILQQKRSQFVIIHGNVSLRVIARSAATWQSDKRICWKHFKFELEEIEVTLRISSIPEELYIIVAKAQCSLWLMRYTLRVMIYALRR